MAFEVTLDAIPAVSGLNGQPRKRPGKLHADKGYDFVRCRRYLKQRAIAARIARKGQKARSDLDDIAGSLGAACLVCRLRKTAHLL